MSADEDEGRTFLSRWSRRKIAARQAEAQPADAPSPAAAVQEPVAERGSEPAAPALPEVESLQGVQSEYRDFLRPEVDESLRRSALKKLFADPHFNVMDGLDVYIDDYSKPDPIPQALLRSLNQARGLRLFENEEAESPADAAAQQEEPVPATGLPDETPSLAAPPVTDCHPETEGPDSCPDAVPSARKTS